MRRPLSIALAIFLAGLVSFAISRLDRPAPPASVVSTTTTPPPPTARTDDPLATIDQTIAFYRDRAETTPSPWLDWEFVGNAYMSRARLSGDYADWRHAEDAIESSFRAARTFGPYLTRATLNFSMHRLDRVDADLDAAEHAGLITPSDYDAILAMRADTRFYTGRYAEALEIYDGQILRTRRSVDALVALAQLDWHTGHFEEASALLDEARMAPRISSDRGGTMRSWVLQMRASMERDRGHLDEALAAIDAAHELTPNDAHVDELAAALHEARGDDDEALSRYRSVAARTTSPQALDGIALILRRRGDTITASELVALARQSYEAQIAFFPEAAYGHAIDHWLRLEPSDVDRMITIAEGNAEARPYGETRTKLAMAYLLAGRVADARSTLDALLATEWNTADLHGVNAIVLAREGRDAESERAVAESIAPGVMSRLAWLDPASVQ